MSLINKKNFLADIENGSIDLNTSDLEKYSTFLKENSGDIEIFQKAVYSNSGALEYANDKLKDNTDLVLNSINQWGPLALSFASQRIKDDKEIVQYAISVWINNREWHCPALKYISYRLKQDPEIILDVLQCQCDIYEEISEINEIWNSKFADDKNFILKAISIEESVFYYVSDRLKNDFDILNYLNNKQ